MLSSWRIEPDLRMMWLNFFIYFIYLLIFLYGFGYGACMSTLSLWAWLKDMIWCGSVHQKESRNLGIFSSVASTGDLWALARGWQAQSEETARGDEWQLHGERGCGNPVDRQFLILDPGFSSLDSWWRRRVMVGRGVWSTWRGATEYSGNAWSRVEDLMAVNLADLEFEEGY